MSKVNYMKKIQESYAHNVKEYLYAEVVIDWAKKAEQKRFENQSLLYETYKENSDNPKTKNQINDIMHSHMYDEATEPISEEYEAMDKLDENVKKWLKSVIGKKASEKTRDIDCDDVYEYIRTIKDANFQKDAIEKLYEIVNGDDNNLYINEYDFLSDLYNELLESEDETSDTFIKKQKLLSITTNIGIGTTNELSTVNELKTKENDSSKAKDHLLYMSLRDNLELIPEEKFDELFQNYYKEIKNPYTKKGMQLLYIYQTARYMKQNINYEPNGKMLNKAIPAFAIQKSLDYSDIAAYLEGAASQILDENTELYKNMGFITGYCQEFDVGKGVWQELLDKKCAKDGTLKYLPFIKYLSEQKDKEAIKYFVNNYANAYINKNRDRLLENNNGKISPELYISMILHKYQINDITDSVKKVSLKTKEKQLSSQTMFDLGTLMLILEEDDEIVGTKMKKQYCGDFAQNWIETYLQNGKQVEGLEKSWNNMINPIVTLEKEDNKGKDAER